MPTNKNAQRWLTEENQWPDVETGELPAAEEPPPEPEPPAA